MQYFETLNIEGIQDALILLDIDGTIATDSQTDVSRGVVKKIETLKQQNQIVLCSNSNDHERNHKVAKLLGLKYLETNLKKPRKAILNLVDCTPFTHKIVIGDKLTTDGLFAKNIGARFIKVKRIESKEEDLYTKCIYWVDDLLSKFLVK